MPLRLRTRGVRPNHEPNWVLQQRVKPESGVRSPGANRSRSQSFRVPTFRRCAHQHRVGLVDRHSLGVHHRTAPCWTRQDGNPDGRMVRCLVFEFAEARPCAPSARALDRAHCERDPPGPAPQRHKMRTQHLRCDGCYTMACATMQHQWRRRLRSGPRKHLQQHHDVVTRVDFAHDTTLEPRSGTLNDKRVVRRA